MYDDKNAENIFLSVLVGPKGCWGFPYQKRGISSPFRGRVKIIFYIRKVTKFGFFGIIIFRSRFGLFSRGEVYPPLSGVGLK